MSQRNRFADAALGLVVGLGISLLILVWAVPGFRDPFDHQIGQPNTEQIQPERDDGHQGKPVYWYLFTLDDTIAQWLMVMFTVAATGLSLYAVKLLRNTLDANTEAVGEARKANALAQADKRPWIKFSCVPDGEYGDLGVTGTHMKIVFRATVENIGEKPAIDIKEHAKIIRASLVGAYHSAVTDYVDDIVRRERHSVKGSVIYPNDPIDTKFTMETFVKRDMTEEKKLPHHAFDNFLLYCVTYRGIGLEDYYHNAQIYQINRFGVGDDKWDLLRVGQAQSIT